MAPYDKWLGRASERPWENYYELLQVPLGCDDAQRISRHAKHLIVRVRKVDPGEFQQDWTWLLNELATAARILLDADSRAEYNRQLKQRTAARAANQSGIEPHTESPAPSTRSTAIDPMAPVDPVTHVDPMAPVDPLGTKDSFAQDEPTPLTATPSPPATSQLSAPPIIGGQVSGSTSPARSRRRARTNRRRWPWKQMLLACSCLSLLMIVVWRFGTTGSREVERRVDRVVVQVKATEPSTTSAARPSIAGRPVTQQQESDDDHQSIALQHNKMEALPETTGKMTADMDRQAVESEMMMAKEKRHDESVPLSVEEATALSGYLKTAVNAMALRDFTKAKEHITKAATIAHDPQHVLVVEGMDELAHYVEQYWLAYEEGVKGIEAGLDYRVGSTVVHIVSTSEEGLVLRAAGQNRSYKWDSLPSVFVREVIESWLSKDAASTKVIMGARYAVGTDNNVTLAKQYWAEANSAGVDTSRLLRVIETPLEAGSFLKSEQ
jgi:hypothetical protein